MSLENLSLRLPLPGEVMHFSELEAHCIFSIMERIEAGVFGNSVYTNFSGLKEAFVNESAIILTPSEADRILFTIIVKEELAGLVVRQGGTLGACGHTTYEHERCLKLWLEREIVSTKAFSDSRAALRNLSQYERIFGPQRLTVKDAGPLMKEEIERQQNISDLMNLRSRKYRESLNDEEREDFDTCLERMLEVKLQNTREQLWAILKKRGFLPHEENTKPSD